MTKILFAFYFLSSTAIASPVCVLNEIGSDDVQMSNVKSTIVELYAEDDKLKEFKSVLYPEYSFKANHYSNVFYVGIYKDGKELARAGGKDWTQLVSQQPGKNPFGVMVVDCYSSNPSKKSDLAVAPAPKTESSAPAGYTGTYAATATCPDGSILTQYGCLPVDTKVCPSGNGQKYALFNNMCIPAINSQYGNYNFYPYNAGNPNGNSPYGYSGQFYRHQ